MTEALAIEPAGGPLDATVTVPGSKSLTNRALLLAALAAGTSTVDNILLADDTEAMLGALDALEISYELDRAACRLVAHGAAGVPPAAEATIDARRSGTTARFLLPVLAALPGRYRVTGSEQLRARPVADLLEAISALGATVASEGDDGRLPAVVGGGYRDRVARVRGDVTSQFLSGLMLAGPLVPGGIVVECTTDLVSLPYVEMTAETMAAFGATASIRGRRIEVEPGGYTAARFVVEPDASSASYFLAAAALVGGSVRVRGLTRASRQGDVRFVDVLARMGATVIEHADEIEVRGTGALRGVEVDLHDLPDMALTVAALAPFAEGPTTVRGVDVIRGHESDRIAVVVHELDRLGVRVEETGSGFRVEPAAAIRPATVATYDDHRVAMAFALVGLRAPGIRIADPGCVSKTFPGFFDVLSSLRPR